MARQSLLTSLDMGSDKVAIYIGEALPDVGLRILGFGIAPSRGIEGGRVVDLDLAARSIRHALSEAEDRAGCEVYSVLANAAGTNIEGRNCCGLVVLEKRERPIASQDIRRAIQAASSSSIPFNEQVISSEVQGFVVDQQEGIRNPIGMVGTRLGAYCHIVTAPALELENIKRCVQRAGLEIEQWLPDALASVHAVLTHEEKELGVAVIDIGGGSSDLSVISRGSAHFTDRLSVGSRVITERVAHEFRTTFESAERVIRRLGCFQKNVSHNGTKESIPGVSGRSGQSVPVVKIKEVIDDETRKLLETVKARLVQSGQDVSRGAGAVLCGGFFMLEGSIKATEKILKLPVRIGQLRDIQASGTDMLSPIHTVGLGLLRYSKMESETSGYQTSRGRLGRFFERTVEWIQETF